MAASELAAWEASTVACGWHIHGCLSLGLPNLVADGPQQGASRGLGAGMGVQSPTLSPGGQMCCQTQDMAPRPWSWARLLSTGLV